MRYLIGRANIFIVGYQKVKLEGGGRQARPLRPALGGGDGRGGEGTGGGSGRLAAREGRGVGGSGRRADTSTYQRRRRRRRRGFVRRIQILDSGLGILRVEGRRGEAPMHRSFARYNRARPCSSANGSGPIKDAASLISVYSFLFSKI
jgi:hypothetical protein